MEVQESHLAKIANPRALDEQRRVESVLSSHRLGKCISRHP